MSNGDSTGKTIKELVIEIDAKLDKFIDEHERAHRDESAESVRARSSAEASPAGRAIVGALATLTNTVTGHERAIQRLYGAVGLASFLGVGALTLVFLRIAGILS